MSHGDDTLRVLAIPRLDLLQAVQTRGNSVLPFIHKQISSKTYAYAWL